MSLPRRSGEAVAEPLVRELVGDQPLRLAVEVVGAEDRLTLRLQRELERVGADHHRVAGLERVGPEPLDEDVEHLELAGEGQRRTHGERRGGRRPRPGRGPWPGPGARSARRGAWPGTARSAPPARRPRSCGCRGAAWTAAGRWPPRGSSTPTVIADPERRLLPSEVVAREPRRCAAGLGRPPGPRRSAPPTRPVPRWTGSGRGCPSSGRRRRTPCPAAIGVAGVMWSLPPALGPARRRAVDGHLADPEPDEVEGEPRRGRRRPPR